MSYVLLLCLVQFFFVCDIVVFVCFMICVVLFRGRPIIGADIKHFYDYRYRPFSKQICR